LMLVSHLPLPAQFFVLRALLQPEFLLTKLSQFP
jgi:hypothetical protein